MRALDTNALVRLITDDDHSARDKVVQLVETAGEQADMLMLPIPVLLETIWVLDARYDFARTAILDALERLLLVKGLRFEASRRVRELIRLGRSTSTDLADIQIGLCARDLGGETTWTFDKKAARNPLFTRIQ